MTTIRFLAKIAGVAPSTVSRALRNDPSIGPAMRLRIQELARDYHYHPNQLMHGLLTGQSGVIGMVLPRLSVSFDASMLSAMLEAAMAAGYRTLIFESHGWHEKTQYAVHAMIEQRVDGAILYTGQVAPLPRELLLGLRSHGIPLVSIDATPGPPAMDTVRTDEMQLAGLAVDYLISLGHRRIAWLGPHYGPHQSLRCQAVLRSLEKRLLSTHYCLDTTGRSYEQVGAPDIIDRLLAHQPHPTALIAEDDHIAARVLSACHLRGVEVPGMLSILGCGNLTAGEFTLPTLTTIEQYPDRIGRKAVELLLARMHAADEAPPAMHLMASQLIRRASCGRAG